MTFRKLVNASLFLYIYKNIYTKPYYIVFTHIESIKCNLKTIHDEVKCFYIKLYNRLSHPFTNLLIKYVSSITILGSFPRRLKRCKWCRDLLQKKKKLQKYIIFVNQWKCHHWVAFPLKSYNSFSIICLIHTYLLYVFS